MLQIPDWMDFHADIRPGDTAIVTPKLTLTFGQMRAASVAAALKLQEDGIKSGQKVAVQAISPALQFVLFLALQRLGVITAMLPLEPTRRKAALTLVKFDWLITDKDEGFSTAKLMPIELEWLTKLKLTDKRLPGGFKNPDDVCLIAMTSGTTSAPKPMAYTVGMIEQRVTTRALGDQGCQRAEKTIILAGLGAMNGVQTIFGTLWCGGGVYMGYSPSDAMEVVARDRIDRLFCAAPLLAKALETVETKAWDVSSLKQIYAGGDSLSPQLTRRVMTRMCKNLLTGFSTNEVGRVAIATFERTEVRSEEVGHLFPWAEAEAVDEKDNVLPAGREGHLRFRTQGMLQGYLDNPEATAERFRHGWFYSDDIGWVTPQKLLVITGRTKEFVHAKSGRFNPKVIDHAFSGHPKIVEAAGFGMPQSSGPDQIWLALVPRMPIDDAELKKFCAEKFGPRAPTHFLRLNRLPRNEGGKVVRATLVQLAQDSKAEA